jgi:hypothetical protein
MSEEITILRQDILEIKSMMKLLLPKQYTVSYLSQQTGKSRQAIRGWLIRNGEPEVDYWEKGGKIYVSEETALLYISKRRG